MTDAELILDKLCKMVIHGVSFDLMRSYSGARQQYMVINGCISEKVDDVESTTYRVIRSRTFEVSTTCA